MEGFYLGPLRFDWLLSSVVITTVLAIGWMRSYWDKMNVVDTIVWEVLKLFCPYWPCLWWSGWCDGYVGVDVLAERDFRVAACGPVLASKE
jgi:hypothetical protein